MKKYHLLFLALFLLARLQAQKQQDYIISMKRDTFYGKIKLFSYSNKIVFKNKETKAIFYPEMVLSFGIYKKEQQEYVLFKPIRTYGQQKVFLKVLSEGSLKLYEHVKHEVSRTGVSVNTYYYLGRTKESLQLLVPDYYEPVLGYFFKDNITLTKQLSQTTFYDIPELVSQFNLTAKEIIFNNNGK